MCFWKLTKLTLKQNIKYNSLKIYHKISIKPVKYLWDELKASPYCKMGFIVVNYF
jgi:hypothetical protein